MKTALSRVYHSIALIFSITVFLSFVVTTTEAQSHVGVAYTLVDMGMVEKGSQNIATFDLVTSTSESFLVSLNKEPSTKDFFSRSGYQDYILNYSEEDVMGWVEIFDNFVEVEILKEKEGIVGARKEVSFVVNVPDDAEPGYHIFRIKPLPILSQETVGQVGTKIVSVTSVTFLLNVEGDAVRDGIILDTVSVGIDGNRLITDTYFQNTGTTTITASSTQGIYKEDNLIGQSPSSKELVKPGDVKVLRTYFTAAGFSEGDYDVTTTVDFITGSVSKNSTINIAPVVLPPVVVVEEKPEPLIWIVIILIVIVAIAILIYKW